LRIVRYSRDGIESYGILSGSGRVTDLPQLADLKRRTVPHSLEGLISLGSSGEGFVESLIGELSGLSASQRRKITIKESSVVLRAPIVSPSKIVCLGLNYRDHAEEGGVAVPDEPVIFLKPRTAIIGPGEPIVKPCFVKELDYEVELAILISKRGRDIPVSQAKDFIFGYAVFNDVSARDIQFKDKQWTRGKSFDTFAPIGPCIATAKQIGDPNNLGMRTWVNGELRQSSSTKRMVFNVYEVVYHLSRVMTLEPCDIIATGTPAGVAAFMKPERKFLEPGNIVEVEIDGIGTLRNPVVQQ